MRNYDFRDFRKRSNKIFFIYDHIYSCISKISLENNKKYNRNLYATVVLIETTNRISLFSTKHDNEKQKFRMQKTAKTTYNNYKEQQNKKAG